MVSSSCVFVPGWIDPSMHSQLQEEKIAAVQAKLEHAEQELAQFAKLPEMEEQLKQRMEALTQVRRPNQVRRGIHFHHIKISPLYDHRSFSIMFSISLSCPALSFSISLFIVLVCLMSDFPSRQIGAESKIYCHVCCAGNFISWSSFTFFVFSLVEICRNFVFVRGNFLDRIFLEQIIDLDLEQIN